MAERIKSNYSEAPNKDALLAEIEARRAEGRDIPDVNANSKREDMESALELDDESRENAATSAKASKATGIPQVEVSPVPEVTTHNPPTDDQFTDGTFIEVSSGLPYALCIHEPDNYGKTHTLKNSANFKQLTAAEFRAQFDKA